MKQKKEKPEEQEKFEAEEKKTPHIKDTFTLPPYYAGYLRALGKNKSHKVRDALRLYWHFVGASKIGHEVKADTLETIMFDTIFKHLDAFRYRKDAKNREQLFSYMKNSASDILANLEKNVADIRAKINDGLDLTKVWYPEALDASRAFETIIFAGFLISSLKNFISGTKDLELYTKKGGRKNETVDSV